MEFAIATVDLWSEYGYNTMRWRKSVDGTKALVHLEYAKILVPNIQEDPEMQIYNYFDEEFAILMNSPEWTEALENNETPDEG